LSVGGVLMGGGGVSEVCLVGGGWGGTWWRRAGSPRSRGRWGGKGGSKKQRCKSIWGLPWGEKPDTVTPTVAVSGGEKKQLSFSKKISNVKITVCP